MAMLLVSLQGTHGGRIPSVLIGIRIRGSKWVNYHYFIKLQPMHTRCAEPSTSHHPAQASGYML